MFCVSLVWSDI